MGENRLQLSNSRIKRRKVVTKIFTSWGLTFLGRCRYKLWDGGQRHPSADVRAGGAVVEYRAGFSKTVKYIVLIFPGSVN